MMSPLSQKKQRNNFWYRTLSSVILVSFLFNSVLPSNVAAQVFPQNVNLPAPGTFINLSPAFTPAIIKGLTIHPENPLQFDFIVDTGDSKLQGEGLKEEANKLIKYFLASLTVPEKDLWVNLSPYEKNRIIPEGLGVTEMGRDMLALDYMLKHLTASLMYPEDGIGSEFWQRIYKKASEKFGTTDIPVNTFNKVWIVPESAFIWENNNNVFVVNSKLKVMMEEDYLAFNSDKGSVVSDKKDQNLNPDYLVLTTQMIKEIILPELEKEVNEGQNFAVLRQIYHSLILATWYKNNLRDSLLGQVYADKNKVVGVDIEDKDAKEKIYEQYLEAFKKGVYNYIREEYDSETQEVIERKYFSGGVDVIQVTENTRVAKGDIKKQSRRDRASIAQALKSDEGIVKVEGFYVENANRASLESGAVKVTEGPLQTQETQVTQQTDKASLGRIRDLVLKTIREVNFEHMGGDIIRSNQELLDANLFDLGLEALGRYSYSNYQNFINSLMDFFPDRSDEIKKAFLSLKPDEYPATVKEVVERVERVVKVSEDDYDQVAQAEVAVTNAYKDLGKAQEALEREDTLKNKQAVERANTKVRQKIAEQSSIIEKVRRLESWTTGRADRASLAQIISVADEILGRLDTAKIKKGETSGVFGYSVRRLGNQFDLIYMVKLWQDFQNGAIVQETEGADGHLYIRSPKNISYNIARDLAEEFIQDMGRQRPDLNLILDHRTLAPEQIKTEADKNRVLELGLRYANENDNTDDKLYFLAEIFRNWLQQTRTQIAAQSISNEKGRLQHLTKRFPLAVTNNTARILTEFGLRGAYQGVSDIIANKDWMRKFDDQLNDLWDLFANISNRVLFSEYSASGKADSQREMEPQLKKVLEMLAGKRVSRNEVFSDDEKKLMKNAIKDTADIVAKRIFERTAKDLGIILMVRVSEGFGRDEVAESLKANEVIVPEAIKKEAASINSAIEAGQDFYQAQEGTNYPIVDAIIDVIEGTNSFVTNSGGKSLDKIADYESGATSVIVVGKGVRDLGNAPDVYVGQFLTNLGEKAEDFRKQRIAVEGIEFYLSDPELYARHPQMFIAYLEYLARDRGVSLKDLKEEIVIMKRGREKAFLAELEKIKKEIPGLQITQIEDGTVAHGLKAVLTPDQFKQLIGREYGLHKTVLTVGGAPEGLMNLTVAGLMQNEGAIGAVRIYSTQINNLSEEKKDKDKAGDQSRRYAFTQDEQADIQDLRDDSKEILLGAKLFTESDVKGDVLGVFSFISTNGVFKQPGTRYEDGRQVTQILRLSKEEGKVKAEMLSQDQADAASIGESREEFLFQDAQERLREVEKKLAAAQGTEERAEFIAEFNEANTYFLEARNALRKAQEGAQGLDKASLSREGYSNYIDAIDSILAGLHTPDGTSIDPRNIFSGFMAKWETTLLLWRNEFPEEIEFIPQSLKDIIDEIAFERNLEVVPFLNEVLETGIGVRFKSGGDNTEKKLRVLGRLINDRLLAKRELYANALKELVGDRASLAAARVRSKINDIRELLPKGSSEEFDKLRSRGLDWLYKAYLTEEIPRVLQRIEMIIGNEGITVQNINEAIREIDRDLTGEVTGMWGIPEERHQQFFLMFPGERSLERLANLAWEADSQIGNIIRWKLTDLKGALEGFRVTDRASLATAEFREKEIRAITSILQSINTRVDSSLIPMFRIISIRLFQARIDNPLPSEIQSRIERLAFQLSKEYGGKVIIANLDGWRRVELSFGVLSRVSQIMVKQDKIEMDLLQRRNTLIEANRNVTDRASLTLVGDPAKLVIKPVVQLGKEVDMSQYQGEVGSGKIINRRSDALIAHLNEKFRSRIHNEERERHIKLQKIASGEIKADFPDENEVLINPYGEKKTRKQIREEDWKTEGDIPAELDEPGIILTGPWTPFMSISALAGKEITETDRKLYNEALDTLIKEYEQAGNASYVRALKNVKEKLAKETKVVPVRLFADLEDAERVHGDGKFEGPQVISDTINGRVKERVHPEKGKTYKVPPQNEWPAITIRLSGIHMPSRHQDYKGDPSPEIIRDLVYAIETNYEALEKDPRQGITLVIAKLQTAKEVGLIIEMMREVERYFGLENPINIVLMVETAEANLELEEMIWMGKEHVKVVNVGRWDYGARWMSLMYAKERFISPDVSTVGMNRKHMDKGYVRRTSSIAKKRGVKQEGGMVVTMASEGNVDPVADLNALINTIRDKLYERSLGYDYGWAATPTLVPVLELLFKEVRDEEVKYDEVKYNEEALEEIFAKPEGQITSKGVYEETYQLMTYILGYRNSGAAVAIDNLSNKGRAMFDLATAKKSQFWLWMLRDAKQKLADTGVEVTWEYINSVIDQVIANTPKYKKLFSDSEVAIARNIIKHLVTSDRIILQESIVINHVVDERDEKVVDTKLTQLAKSRDALLSEGDTETLKVHDRIFPEDAPPDRAQLVSSAEVQGIVLENIAKELKVQGKERDLTVAFPLKNLALIPGSWNYVRMSIENDLRKVGVNVTIPELDISNLVNIEEGKTVQDLVELVSNLVDKAPPDAAALTVANRVKKILKKILGVLDADVQLTRETKLDETLDSLDLIDFRLELEDEFGVEFDFYKASAEWKTLGDVYDFIRSRVPADKASLTQEEKKATKVLPLTEEFRLPLSDIRVGTVESIISQRSALENGGTTKLNGLGITLDTKVKDSEGLIWTAQEILEKADRAALTEVEKEQLAAGQKAVEQAQRELDQARQKGASAEKIKELERDLERIKSNYEDFRFFIMSGKPEAFRKGDYASLSTKQKKEVDGWARFLDGVKGRGIELPYSKSLDYWRLSNEMVLPGGEKLTAEPVEQNYLAGKLWNHLQRSQKNLDSLKRKYGIPIDQMIPKEKLDEIIEKEGQENLMNLFTITGGVSTGIQAISAAEAGLLALYFSGWQASNEYGMADLAKYYFTLVTDMIEKINQRMFKKNQDQQARYKTMFLAFGQVYEKIAQKAQEIVTDNPEEKKQQLQALKQEFMKSAMKTIDSQEYRYIFYQNSDYVNGIRKMLGRLFDRVVQIASNGLSSEQKEKRLSDALDTYADKTMRQYMIDYLIPFFADGDTGHGKMTEQIYYFVKKAMAASIHLEDQTDSDKKCGHMAGKVKVPRKQHVKRLIEGRVAALLLRSKMLFIARTDTEETKLLSNLTDVTDHPFVKGTIDIKIPSLEFMIRLSRREIIESSETPEQILEKIAVDYPEFDQSVKDIWKILDAIRADGKDTRYDATTDNVALRKAMERLTGQWANRARPITFIDAVKEVFNQSSVLSEEDRQRLIKEWEAETDPVKQILTIDQLKQLAKKDKYSIEIYWDYEKPRTYEGYYQVKPGVKMAVVMAREYKRFAEIVWMEQKGPHLEHAYEFAAGVNKPGDSKRVFMALNLSPSFNWSNPDNWKEYLSHEDIERIKAAYAREDFNWQDRNTWGDMDTVGSLTKMLQEIRKFSVKMGLLGYGFQFVTIFSDNITTLAMLQTGRDLLKYGVAGFVERVQQVAQRSDVKNIIVVGGNQNAAGALLNTAYETMSAGGTDSFVDPTGKDATQGQFGVGKKDHAQLNTEKDKAQLGTPVGGIDLNPALINLQIKRDGNGVPLPLPQQPIQDMNIEGFLPVIINITPVNNLPLLLGIKNTEEAFEVSAR